MTILFVMKKHYVNIRRYIVNNPLKWELDVENEKNKTKSVDKYYEDIMNGD